MNKKTWVSAIATVFLGVVGSAFWEVLKPLLGWSWDASISITTLGLNSIRDGIYAGSASALPETLYQSHTNKLLAALMLILCSVLLRFSPKSEDKDDRRWASIFSILFLLGGVLALASAQRMLYSAQLAVYNARLEQISAAFLSPKEVQIHHARFLMIRNRGDYLERIMYLTQRIEESGQKVPPREFF